MTGKSGSGKSTLLYIISTLDNPTSGIIQLGDHNITEMSNKELHEFRNRHMGFIFQFHFLLPEFTALENVLMPALKANLRAKKREYAIHLLESFDLKHRLNYLPAQLSGGEAQRVAIARSLIMEPDYIFADEPTGSLDSTNANNVMTIFRKVNREKKCTIIYVTHDEEFASMANRKIQLHDGTIAFDKKLL